jgi:hypothetical protein
MYFIFGRSVHFFGVKKHNIAVYPDNYDHGKPTVAINFVSMIFVLKGAAV